MITLKHQIASTAQLNEAQRGQRNAVRMDGGGKSRLSNLSNYLSLLFLLLFSLLGSQEALAGLEGKEGNFDFNWIAENYVSSNGLGTTSNLGNGHYSISWSGLNVNENGNINYQYTEDNVEKQKKFFKIQSDDSYVTITADEAFRVGDRILIYAITDNTFVTKGYRINEKVTETSWVNDTPKYFEITLTNDYLSGDKKTVTIKRTDGGFDCPRIYSVGVIRIPTQLYLFGSHDSNWSIYKSGGSNYAANSVDGVFTWRNLSFTSGNSIKALPSDWNGVKTYGPDNNTNTTFNATGDLTGVSAPPLTDDNSYWTINLTGTYDVILDVLGNKITLREATTSGIVDDLTLTKLHQKEKSSFSWYTGWDTDTYIYTDNKHDYKSNAKSSSGKLGILADENHYITHDKSNGYVFNVQLDHVSPFMVIEPTSPGTLVVSVKGDNTKHAEGTTYGNNRNMVSITTSPSFDTSAPSVDSNGGWKRTVQYTSTPGKLYIAAFDGQTITGIDWYPYQQFEESRLSAPTLLPKGNNVEMVQPSGESLYSDKGADEKAAIAYYFTGLNTEYTVDQGSANYTSQDATWSNANAPTPYINGTTVEAKTLVRYKNLNSGTTQYKSASTKIDLVPQFTVDANTGKITITGNPIPGYTYYYTYTTDGSEPNNPTTSSANVNTNISQQGTLRIKVKAFRDNSSTDYQSLVGTKSNVVVGEQTPKNITITKVEPDGDNIKITVATSGEGGDGNIGLLWAKNGANFGGSPYSINQGVATVPKSDFANDQIKFMAYNTIGTKSKWSNQVTTLGVDNGAAVLINPDFEATESLADFGWTATGITNSHGGTGDNHVAESWNQDFNVYQELTGLSSGIYEITANAFHRTHDYADAEAYNAYVADPDTKRDARVNVWLYGNDNYECQVHNVYKVNGWDETLADDGIGYGDPVKYYPNGVNSSAFVFEEDAYKVKFRAVVGNDGILKVGIKGTGTNQNQYRWTCWDNFTVKRVGDYTEPSELKPLIGSYKWSFKNGKFGAVGTQYNGSSAKTTHLIDNGYLEVVTPKTTGSSYRKMIVEEDGISMPYSYFNSGLHFIIPGPGTIIVRSKASEKLTSNVYGNKGFIQIGTADGYEVPEDGKQTAYFTTNGVDAVKQYDYTGSGSVHVFVGVGLSGCKNGIYEIEYRYNPGDLVAHTTQGTTYTWTGTSNPDIKVDGESYDGKLWDNNYNGTGSYTYGTVINNKENKENYRDLRIVADANHTVTIDPNGFSFPQGCNEEFGYIAFPATVRGIVKVYTYEGNGTSVGKNLSIASGTKSEVAENLVPLKDVDNIDANGVGLARTIKVATANTDRMIYISAEPGVKIAKIEWIPLSPVNAVNSELRPVTEETVWARANRFGGYDMEHNATTGAQVNTNIWAPAVGENNSAPSADVGNRMNYGIKATAGYPAVPNQTLLIYGGEGATTTYFTNTGNLMLNNSTANSQRMVEFKVKGPGVVKVEAAGNGPSGRQCDIAALNHEDVEMIKDESSDKWSVTGPKLAKADLFNHSISDMNLEKHSEEYANEQEHSLNFVRHQHSSYHAMFAYYDGSKADADGNTTIIIFADRGVSLQEIHWYPLDGINAVPVVDGKNLSEEGCLKISDKDGNVFQEDGKTPIIPENLYINPRVDANSLPYWWQSDMLATDTYNFYARVETKKEVAAAVKTPVWTTSQAGRKGYTSKWKMSNAKVSGDQDQHTAFDTDELVNGKYVAITGEGHPYTLTVPTRKVVASREAADAIATATSGSWTEPTFGGSGDPKSWGILYVVSGTWEGNRSDIRRIEVAGPPTDLYIEGEKDKTGITIVKGQKALLGGIPVNFDWDDDGGTGSGGWTRMKYVADPTVVQWVLCDENGNDLTTNNISDSEFSGRGGSQNSIALVLNDGVTISNGDKFDDNFVITTEKEQIERTVVKGLEAGTTYVKAYIPASDGVEHYTTNGKVYWVQKYLYKIIPINVIDNEIHLTRVMLDGETMKSFVRENTDRAASNNIEEVDVISPLVYEITGKYKYDDTSAEALADPTKTTQIKALFANDISDNSDVPVNGVMKRAEDGRTFVIFNMTGMLKAGVGNDGNGGKNYYEHSNYDAIHYIKLTDETVYSNMVDNGAGSTMLENPPTVWVDWFENVYDSEGEVTNTIGKSKCIVKYTENGGEKTVTKYSQEEVTALGLDANSIYKSKPIDGKEWYLNDEFVGDYSGTDAEKKKRVLVFKTIHDDCGTELETYIYNVTQRAAKAIADAASGTNELISEHKKAVVFTADRINSDGSPATLDTDANTAANKASATQSWYSNHRSYIRLDGNFEVQGTADDYELVPTDNTGGKGMITLKPYNTRFDSEEQREAINRVALYVDLRTISSMGAGNLIKITPLTHRQSQTGNTALESTIYTKDDIISNNGLVYWQFAEPNDINSYNGWIHNVDIEIADGLHIDQLKVDYYSGKTRTKVAYKTFGNYSSGTFDKNISDGMEMEGISKDADNTEIKMSFRQNSGTRHFSLLERFDRVMSDDAPNRGEPTTKQEKRTALIISDDNTDPCEFYFYNKAHVANIASIEFIYETDHQESQNKLTARDLYCISDPRFVPSNNRDQMIGWTLTDEALADGDYGTNSSNSRNEENDDLGSLRKLVYRPESPVNFAAFAMNCQEQGYLFVRKIIVRIDLDATASQYVMMNANDKDGNRITAGKIKEVPLATDGIRLTVPKADIESKNVAAYLMKRTSLQNNVSKELPLKATEGGSFDLDYYKMVLNSKAGKSNYKHQKNYTVRVLDENRMVIRQLAFRTDEGTAPKIKRIGGLKKDNSNNPVLNEEWRVDQPLDEVPTKIIIEAANTSEHKPANTVIVYTTDGTAPSVEFEGLESRRIKAIKGQVAAGSVEFTQGSSNDVWTANTTSLNALFKKYDNSIVIKALSLPLDGISATTAISDGLVGNEYTFGETTDITRGNYVLIKPKETFITSARRRTRVVGDKEEEYFDIVLPASSPYDINSSTLSQSDVTSEAKEMYGNTADKFHGAYQPLLAPLKSESLNDYADMPEIFTYGGYESFNKTSGDTHKFNHNVLQNEFWEVKGNDATPWRGIREAVVNDTYVRCSIEPYSEKALPLYKSKMIKIDDINNLDGGSSAASDDIRYFVGQFNYNKHISPEFNKGKSYYRTWNLPCYGDYFRFEPTDNGTLTVYVKQQGVLEQEDGQVDDQLLRLRPVYVFDERGETPAGIKASTTSKVSGDWMTMKHTPNTASKYLSANATAMFKHICDQWVINNTAKRVGGNISYIDQKDENDNTVRVPDVEYGDRAYETQGVIVLHGNYNKALAQTKRMMSDGTEALLNYTGMRRTDTYNGRTLSDYIGDRDEENEPNGFMTLSAGYVKYEFPVRAGKTYFMFASNGNLGFCSYTFKGENTTVKDFTITDDGDDGEVDGTGMNALLAQVSNNKNVCNVAMNRKFKNKVWAALVLPFSVSMHQLREQFGEGVRVVYFNDISTVPNAVIGKDDYNNDIYGPTDRISVRHHVHELVVAGVPVFIRPWRTDLGDNVEFTVNFSKVTVEVDKVEDVIANVGDYVAQPEGPTTAHYDNYRCTGSFTRMKDAIQTGDIYMNASSGGFAQRTNAKSLSINGTRCWLTDRVGSAPNPAPRFFSFASNSSTSTGSYSLGETTDDGSGNDNGGVTTELETIEVGGSYIEGKVYNLKGQVVANSADDLKHLPQGVYMINGVKHVVK